MVTRKKILKHQLLNNRFFKNKIYCHDIGDYIYFTDEEIDEIRKEIKKDAETTKNSVPPFIFNPIIKIIKSKICGQ